MRSLKRYGSTFRFREFANATVKKSEPWMYRQEEIFWVPVSFCKLFADPKRITLLERTEPDYLNEIQASVMDEGMHEPATMVLDESGKMRYHDGYHRMIVSERIGRESIPVVLKIVERVNGYGRQVSSTLFKVLFSNAPQPKEYEVSVSQLCEPEQEASGES